MITRHFNMVSSSKPAFVSFKTRYSVDIFLICSCVLGGKDSILNQFQVTKQRENRNNTDEISPRTPSVCCSGPSSLKTSRWKPRVRPLVDWLTSGRRSINDSRFAPRTKHVNTPVYETPRRHVVHHQPTFTNTTRRFFLRSTWIANKMPGRHVPAPYYRSQR